MNRCLLFMAILLPSIGFAQEEDGRDTNFQSMSNAQLCALSDSPEALKELERRDVFSERELRSIEKRKIRRNISEAALYCIYGEPDQTFSIEGIWIGGKEYYAAYVFFPYRADRVVALIRREGNEVIVGSSTTLRPGAPLPFYLYSAFPETSRDSSYYDIRCGGKYISTCSGALEPIGSSPYDPPLSQQIEEYEGEPF